MRATWYFDFISPFAYLHFKQFAKLPAALEVEHVPVLFAGLLKAHGHKGPAEIAEKRRQTYRICVWQAREQGIAMRFPPAHPFNPLNALRLCVAAGATARAVELIFDSIWKHGQDINAVPTLAALAQQLDIPDAQSALADPQVKQRLLHNTAAAVERGIYGVPTFDFAGELFWGADALGLMCAYANDPGLFRQGEFARVDGLPQGAARKP